MSLQPLNPPVLSPIDINLAVELDASGNVTIYGEGPEPITAPIYSEVELPVTDLYDGSNSFFEFQEPSDSTGIRKGYLSVPAHEGRDHKLLVPSLVNDLQAVFTGSFDCSASAPFDNAAYSSSAALHKASSIGDFALKLYAHFLLGHVAATAAITNDADIVNGMNYTSIPNLASYVGTEAAAWAATAGSASQQDIVKRLVGAILTKAEGTTSGGITAIVNQVIGRDANRAVNEDNNQAYGPEEWAPLKFIVGDRLLMKLKFNVPSVELGGNADTTGQKVGADVIQARYGTSQKEFMVVIPLKA
jgi:hypothetical protein